MIFNGRVLSRFGSGDIGVLRLRAFMTLLAAMVWSCEWLAGVVQ